MLDIFGSNLCVDYILILFHTCPWLSGWETVGWRTRILVWQLSRQSARLKISCFWRLSAGESEQNRRKILSIYDSHGKNYHITGLVIRANYAINYFPFEFALFKGSWRKHELAEELDTEDWWKRKSNLKQLRRKSWHMFVFLFFLFFHKTSHRHAGADLRS